MSNFFSCFGKKTKMDSAPMHSTLLCPFAIKWEINEEKLQALKNSENGYLETDLFDASNIPGVQYCLTFYPNGSRKERQGQAWIFLMVKVGKEQKVKADHKYIFETPGSIIEMSYEHKHSGSWGISCCNTADLFDTKKKYIVNGKLIVKCQGTLSVQREYEAIKWEKNDICSELWKRNDKDFTFFVGGNQIQAHKSFLATHSRFFDAMFNAKMNEATTDDDDDDNSQMDITEFSLETVKIALELCYNRKISTLTFKEKIDVLPFLNKYAIFDLKDSLEVSLIEEISYASVCQIANYSVISNSIQLQERCIAFLVSCLKMDQTVTDFDYLDEVIALKVFQYSYYNVAKN